MDQRFSQSSRRCRRAMLASVLVTLLSGVGAGGRDEPILAWGKKVSPEFKARIVEIARDLKADPDHLMAAIAFETAETFRPDIKNAAGSGATGLIQFMPATARSLGTTTEALAAMSAVEQLTYVHKYLAPYRGKLNEVEDLYMSILWPRAVGKEPEYVLFTQGTRAYDQNKGLDSNRDGKITKREAGSKVRAKLEKGRTPAWRG